MWLSDEVPVTAPVYEGHVFCFRFFPGKGLERFGCLNDGFSAHPEFLPIHTSRILPGYTIGKKFGSFVIKLLKHKYL